MCQAGCCVCVSWERTHCGHKDNHGLCPGAKPSCSILVGGAPSCNPQLHAGTWDGSKLFHLLQPQQGVTVWHFCFVFLSWGPCLQW